MHHSKAQLIVGGGVAVLALLGIAVSFLRTTSVPLMERVLALYPSAGESPQQRHADVAGKIAAVESIRQDSDFGRLPEPQRQYVDSLLKELRDYQEYERKVLEIPSPTEARTEEQLSAIQKKLQVLEVPGGYAVEWALTDAGKRHRELLEDAQALEMTVYATRRHYLQLADAGKDVLRTVDAPELPRRARDVIERGQKLPVPDKNAKTQVPGSPRITYATVFEFGSVREALKAWNKVRDELQPLTLSPRP